MTGLPLEISEDQYFEFISFLFSSAYLMYKGEQYEELYPSLRLMDAAVRFTKILISNGSFKEYSWQHSFVEDCESGFDLMSTDKDAFIQFIDDTTLMLAKEMKNRSPAD